MNINQIKQKLEQFQSTTNNASSVVWKAPAGKSQIRLVEYKHNKDNPFVELYFHFNIMKNKPILSPISYGEPDPIVEFAQKLKKTGSKEDFLLSRKLEPKMRVFAPIVIRGSEAEGVKIWGFGKTVSTELMSIIVDPDYGNIADTLKGRDVVVEVITPQEAGNQFGKTNIRVKPAQTPLHTDASLVQKILDNQPVITDLYTKYTYDELKEILKNYLQPPEDMDEEKKKEPESVTSTKTKSAKVESVNDAFDNIFNS